LLRHPHFLHFTPKPFCSSWFYLLRHPIFILSRHALSFLPDSICHVIPFSLMRFFFFFFGHVINFSFSLTLFVFFLDLYSISYVRLLFKHMLHHSCLLICYIIQPEFKFVHLSLSGNADITYYLEENFQESLK
jgi:hypothetical protein